MDWTTWLHSEQGLGSPGTLGLLCLGAMGLILWGFGRKLARTGYTLSGMMAGMALALAIPQSHQSGYMMLGYLAVGGGVGLIVSWMLFRVAAGFTLALTLAILLPAAALAWQSQTFPQPPKIQITVEQPADGQNVPEALEERLLAQRDAIKTWIGSFQGSSKRSSVVLAICGILLGLMTGLIAPYWATSGQTSLVGSSMILISLHNLLPRLPLSLKQPLIDNPRQGLFFLGLITLAGIGLQWIIWRKKTDK